MSPWDNKQGWHRSSITRKIMRLRRAANKIRAVMLNNLQWKLSFRILTLNHYNPSERQKGKNENRKKQLKRLQGHFQKSWIDFPSRSTKYRKWASSENQVRANNYNRGNHCNQAPKNVKAGRIGNIPLEAMKALDNISIDKFHHDSTKQNMGGRTYTWGLEYRNPRVINWTKIFSGNQKNVIQGQRLDIENRHTQQRT